ncbi:MAG: gephyrin-like molybdotransferase Glp [Chthoniobacterales bacterium]
MMLSEAEAAAAVLAKVAPLPRVEAQLIDSLGRFAARDVHAVRSLPPFDNSAMDGYAVQATSCAAGARLRVVGEQPAGQDRGLAISAGEALRIFTGAPMPAGADAVIMQEDVTREGETIVANYGVEPGEFFRRRGSDLAEGQTILSVGEIITPAVVGLLSSQGMATIEVGARPRVAIVSTGDELARPGETPQPGQIFESNSVMLHALALAAGAEINWITHSPDDLDRLVEILRHGLDHDVLIVSGGVSVGDRDFVKPALRQLGAEIDLWRVAIKPGKPFLFGRTTRCAIFGLPGNPVSGFVTFLKLVRPALRKLAGASAEHSSLRYVPAQLRADLTNDGDRPHYFHGRLDGGVFSLSGRQESHALFGLSRANALLRVAPGARLTTGATVSVELWD